MILQKEKPMSKMPDNIKKMWEEAAKYNTGGNKKIITNPPLHGKKPTMGRDIHGNPVPVRKYPPKTGPGPEPNPIK